MTLCANRSLHTILKKYYHIKKTQDLIYIVVVICITLFRSKTMLCGTDIILHDIFYIMAEYEEYSS